MGTVVSRWRDGEYEYEVVRTPIKEKATSYFSAMGRVRELGLYEVLSHGMRRAVSRKVHTAYKEALAAQGVSGVKPVMADYELLYPLWFREQADFVILDYSLGLLPDEETVAVAARKAGIDI